MTANGQMTFGLGSSCAVCCDSAACTGNAAGLLSRRQWHLHLPYGNEEDIDKVLDNLKESQNGEANPKT